MKTTKMLTVLVLASAIMVWTAEVSEAAAMGTAFTYQGHLYDNNDVADGEYDFRFSLYDVNVGGAAVANDVNVHDVDVIDAYFTVELDFGGAVFDGNAVWLEIGVRPGELNDSNAYTPLSPRQEVTPTPYALYAKTAGGDNDWMISGNDMYSLPPGNVGIGTQSPTSLLEIASSDSGVIDSLKLRTYQGSGGSGVKINFGIGAVTGGKIENIFAGDEADLIFSSYSNSGGLSEKMRITGGGNVGIGTTAPSAKLDVVGNTELNGNVDINSDLDVDAGTLHVDGTNNRVGIGTTSPAYKLDVSGDIRSTGSIYGTVDNADKLDGQHGSYYRDWNNLTNVPAGFADGVDDVGTGGDSDWIISGNDMYSAVSGNVGIGTTNPLSTLSVGGDGLADSGVYASGFAYGVKGVDSDDGSNGRLGTAGYGVYGEGVYGVYGGGTTYGVMGQDSDNGPYGRLGYDTYGGYFVGDGYFSGNVGIGTTSPSAKLDVAGNARVQVLEITGGSDLSEQFEISSEGGEVKPGTAVCIDRENPGNLVVSSKAYDRTVAGIVSGAGGLKPGMLMGQKGSKADGKHPVALTGRVWCRADASTGAIQPGDLLTTSSVPGHAMKVSEHSRALGAIIGKAMTSLEKGKGLVLVLVTLQ